jgi:FkbM family methyltransferase
MKELIYKVVDFFTFGRGLSKVFNGQRVRIPTRYINYFPADYEAPNFNFLKQHVSEGSVVLDIGAHIGLFACYTVKTMNGKGKVYAFEPAPATNALLQKTVAINKMGSAIETRSEAMGLKPGKTKFYISNLEGDNSNSLVDYLEDREMKGIDITVASVDSFVQEKKLDKVSFIKIDVEGAEYDTIRGAETTLKTLKPVCILAIHPVGIKEKGDTLEDIYDFVKSCSYNIILDDAPLSREDFIKTTGLIDLHLLPQ